MSQITCGVVRDLLPLYVDGCCGADSRRLVEEHLAGCPDCRRARADMAGELPPAEGAPVPEAEPARAMKTGLKKLRRRWALSLLAVLLIPLLGWLTWNQVHGTGPCFTNFHERMLADPLTGWSWASSIRIFPVTAGWTERICPTSSPGPRPFSWTVPGP